MLEDFNTCVPLKWVWMTEGQNAMQRRIDLRVQTRKEDSRSRNAIQLLEDSFVWITLKEDRKNRFVTIIWAGSWSYLSYSHNNVNRNAIQLFENSFVQITLKEDRKNRFVTIIWAGSWSY